MPHAQSRVTPLFDIHRRSAKSADQEIPQPMFRSGQILRGIDRPQNVVARDLPVKRRDETLESFIPDCGVNLVLFHLLIVSAARFPGLNIARLRSRRRVAGRIRLWHIKNNSSPQCGPI